MDAAEQPEQDAGNGLLPRRPLLTARLLLAGAAARARARARMAKKMSDAPLRRGAPGCQTSVYVCGRMTLSIT